MSDPPPIVFDDGADYERFMGRWSRLAGAAFLDWLAPPPGLAWLDVGCGNGAFSELLFDRAAPSRLEGLDPSAAQVAYARTRLAGHPATFAVGDALALPQADASLDAAVMALVIFFVPDPARGVAEMARAVRPGGLVATYAWDIEGGGFPHEAMREAQRGLGLPVASPPRADVVTPEGLRALWEGAGLREVATHGITVSRDFLDFDAFWDSTRPGPGAGGAKPPPPETVARLREALRARHPTGPITVTARALAVRGVVPS